MPQLITVFIASVKQLRVFLLPPGWDASPSQGYLVPVYTPGGWSTVRVRCLAQENWTVWDLGSTLTMRPASLSQTSPCNWEMINDESFILSLFQNLVLFLIEDSLLVFWLQLFFVLCLLHQMTLKLDQSTLFIYFHVFTGMLSVLVWNLYVDLGRFLCANINSSRQNSSF